MNDDSTGDRPGSEGEHTLQERFETKEQALRFYENSMHDHLNDVMRAFISERIMFFLSTADTDGRTDCSPRLGPQGFVNVLDDSHLAYPEFHGNGIHASLGNIRENPHATLLFVDWWDTTVGLHVNGQATLNDELPTAHDPTNANATKTWVQIDVEEAYIHCAKHLPQLSIKAFEPPRGTDDPEIKKSGFFTE